jgi:hypothetical protein
VRKIRATINGLRMTKRPSLARGDEMKTILAALALAITMPIESAHAAENGFAAMGFGTATCAQFAEIYRDNPSTTEIQFFAWAQGYMSGRNVAQIKQSRPYVNLSLLQTQTQRGLLLHYCNHHPLAHYIDAVDELMSEPEKKGSK